MNPTRIKCLLALLALAMLGFGPVSVTGLIGLFVVLQRPEWFDNVVKNVYRDKQVEDLPLRRQTSDVRRPATGVRIRCLLSLIVLMIVDILPVPVVGSIGLYVLLRRPLWFKDLVDRVYGNRRE